MLQVKKDQHKGEGCWIIEEYLGDEDWNITLQCRDVDPDPDSFGSVDPDPGSRGIKWREKPKKKRQQIRKKLYFTSLNCRHSPDDGYSLRFRFRLRNKKFFLLWKFVLKSIWKIYWPGSGSGSSFIKFCGSGFNQSGSTSLFFRKKWKCIDK